MIKQYNILIIFSGISEVFATAGVGDIRVWCLKTCQELLRIQVANFECSSVLFTYDGKAIVSGWNDGCIRAFTPLTGQLMYCILNTHNKGTTALAITSDGKTLISGGYEGQVIVHIVYVLSSINEANECIQHCWMCECYRWEFGTLKPIGNHWRLFWRNTNALCLRFKSTISIRKQSVPAPTGRV